MPRTAASSTAAAGVALLALLVAHGVVSAASSVAAAHAHGGADHPASTRRQLQQVDDDALVAGRSSRWFLRVSDGDFLDFNVKFIDTYNRSLTGVYLCCAEMYIGVSGQYIQARNDSALEVQLAPFINRQLETWLVLGIATKAMRAELAHLALPDILAAAIKHGVDGIIVDYESGDDYSLGHAQQYARFLETAATAFHAGGVTIGACLDNWSMLSRYDVFASLAPSVDTFMFMGTYNATRVPSPKDQLTTAVADGMDPSVIGVGVGTMVTTGATWDYKWTPDSLQDFVSFAATLGVQGIDVWRADIDHPTVGNTKPWFLETVEQYLHGELPSTGIASSSDAHAAAPDAPPAPRAAAGSASQGQTLYLAVEGDDLLSQAPHRAHFEVNAPYKAGPAIQPTEPWESWAVFGYNGVVDVTGAVPATSSDSYGPYRMYYDCISTKQGASAAEGTTIGFRFTCLAVSTDGVTWTKPSLGIAPFNGSTANNIVFPPTGDQNYHYHEPGSVFVDANPAAPASQRFKMVASWAYPKSGGWAFSSPDGLHWTQMGTTPAIEGSDTKNVGWWDDTLGKYLVYVRLDVSSGSTRRIAVCVTDDLTDWEKEGPRVDIFHVDAQDPLGAGLDVYTNSATLYPSPGNGGGSSAGSYTLFFPSMYYHFSSGAPWGFGNDGILDIRFGYTPPGADVTTTNVSYVAGATNARSPFVQLGPNSCAFDGSVQQKGGWCSPTDPKSMQNTAPDTSAMYAASGYLPSPDGREVYLYTSAQPMTHGGDAGQPVWGSNTQIQRVALRRDGFASVNGDYWFPSNASDLPQVVTRPLTVPALPCPQGQDIVLRVNVVTSVAGSASIELQDGATGAPLTNFSLSESNFFKGDALYRVATWGGGAGSGTTCAFELPGDSCDDPTDGWEPMTCSSNATCDTLTCHGTKGACVGGVCTAAGSELCKRIGGGTTIHASLSSLAGKEVRVRAVIPDARLFGLEFGCGTVMG